MRMISIAGLALSVLTIAHPVIASDRVPLRDGFYAENSEKCAEFRKGELDLPPWQVAKGGRQFQGPEMACIVASVKTVLPPHRHHVQSTCREYDMISHQSFILDTPTRERFSLEDEDYIWCGTTHGQPKASRPTPANNRKLSDRALIDQWGDINDDCRGGSGDDPKTDQACGRRSNTADELKRRGFCYRTVKGGQDWVRCRR